MTAKTPKVLNVMHKNNIDILCLKETKLRGGKTKKLGENYKLLHLVVDRTMNRRG